MAERDKQTTGSEIPDNIVDNTASGNLETPHQVTNSLLFNYSSDHSTVGGECSDQPLSGKRKHTSGSVNSSAKGRLLESEDGTPIQRQ